MEHREMRRRVIEARVARLATVTADGHPHLVPCCFALSDTLASDDVLRDNGLQNNRLRDVVYSAVDAKPKSSVALRRLENLRANPHAALLVDHYSDDWSTLWWVRIDGEGRILDHGPERDAAIAILATKYPVYVDEPPPGPVVAIDVVGWRAWP